MVARQWWSEVVVKPPKKVVSVLHPCSWLQNKYVLDLWTDHSQCMWEEMVLAILQTVSLRWRGLLGKCHQWRISDIVDC